MGSALVKPSIGGPLSVGSIVMKTAQPVRTLLLLPWTDTVIGKTKKLVLFYYLVGLMLLPLSCAFLFLPYLSLIVLYFFCLTKVLLGIPPLSPSFFPSSSPLLFHPTLSPVLSIL